MRVCTRVGKRVCEWIEGRREVRGRVCERFWGRDRLG